MGKLTGFEHNLVGGAIVAIGLLGLYLNKNLYSKNGKQSKPSNLVLHVILNNIALIVIDFPFPVISSFKHDWAFGDFGCTFYGSSSLVFGFNIMLSVVAICLEYSFEKAYSDYALWRDRACNFMIAYMWFNSLFFGLAPVFGWSRIGKELTQTSCTVDFVNADDAYKTYILSCFVVMFTLPLTTMFYCAMRKTETKKSEEYSGNDSKILSQMVAFVIVWTPYAICYMWPLFSDVKNMSVRFDALAPVVSKLSVLTTPLLLLSDMDSSKNKSKINKSN